MLAERRYTKITSYTCMNQNDTKTIYIQSHRRSWVCVHAEFRCDHKSGKYVCTVPKTLTILFAGCFEIGE